MSFYVCVCLCVEEARRRYYDTIIVRDYHYGPRLKVLSSKVVFINNTIIYYIKKMRVPD